MQEATFDEGLDLILARDSRYQREGYVFVREALDYTQKAILKENHGQARHVTGQELLGGIRDYALDQYGPMAITLLDEWGIRTCQDFGEIVFAMVEIGLLAKTDKDSRADFEGGYDFNDAFRKPFLPSSKLRAPEAVSKAEGK
ncbi:MAG: Minf_1886 family protein [Verrucomicrobiota bacterium]